MDIGPELEKLLRAMRDSGCLFPNMAGLSESDRGALFRKRLSGLNIPGVSLHSYRYAWAERARKCGYPKRFAQEALGHKSKAVHRAYVKRAQVTVPSPEQYEQSETNKIVVPISVTGATSPGT